MRFIFIILPILLSISACVTSETSLSGNKLKSEFDPKAAANTRVKLALVYLKDNQMQAAKENLDKALEYQPKNPDIYRFYAYYYEQVKETDKAEEFYKKSISLDSENGDTYHYYGTFLCRKGDYKEAEEVFLKAVKLPNYTNVSSSYRNAAICAEEAGYNEKAIYYYQYALSHSPNSTAINLSLAKLNITEKNYAEAQRNLFKFISTSGQTAESLWQWVRLSYATGKQASLDKYSRDLLQKFPDSQQALNYLNNEYYE